MRGAVQELLQLKLIDFNFLKSPCYEIVEVVVGVVVLDCNVEQLSENLTEVHRRHQSIFLEIELSEKFLHSEVAYLHKLSEGLEKSFKIFIFEHESILWRRLGLHGFLNLILVKLSKFPEVTAPLDQFSKLFICHLLIEDPFQVLSSEVVPLLLVKKEHYDE